MTRYGEALSAEFDGLVLKVKVRPEQIRTLAPGERIEDVDYRIRLSAQQYEELLDDMTLKRMKLVNTVGACQPGDIVKIRFYDGVERWAIMNLSREFLLEHRMISTEDSQSLAEDGVIKVTRMFDREGHDILHTL